jgi:hypothetical protein
MTAAPQQDVEDARLAHALSCWQRWRGSNLWPAREDIDPDDLRQLLPNLFMVEAVDGGAGFRYILSGVTVRQQLGFELSGRSLEDIFTGIQLERATADYRTVISGQGHYARQHWIQRGRRVMQFRRLLLPIAADRMRIDLVLGFALYDPLEDHDGEPIDHLRDPVTVIVIEEKAISLVEHNS